MTFPLRKRFHGARGHKSNRMTVTGFDLAQTGANAHGG
jgi:hypothetical protein